MVFPSVHLPQANQGVMSDTRATDLVHEHARVTSYRTSTRKKNAQWVRRRASWTRSCCPAAERQTL